MDKIFWKYCMNHQSSKRLQFIYCFILSSIFSRLNRWCVGVRTAVSARATAGHTATVRTTTRASTARCGGTGPRAGRAPPAPPRSSCRSFSSSLLSSAPWRSTCTIIANVESKCYSSILQNQCRLTFDTGIYYFFFLGSLQDYKPPLK